MAQSLLGKTAIVTGAGSGINLAFTALLLSRGCNVLLADLTLRREAQALVSAHSAPPPGLGKAVFQKTDVTSWPALSALFATATRHLSSTIDIVVPGAGIFEPPASSFWHPPGAPPSRDSPEHGRYALFDVNLTHPTRMTQLALSHFLSAHSPGVDGDADAGGGGTGGGKPSCPRNTKAIVHVSSIAGQATPLNAPLYNASKHGINGLVRSLAPLERRAGVRVVAVAPGVVKTPLWTEDAGKLRAIDEGVDEWVTPEEVAAVMLALVERDEIASGEGKEMIGIKGGSILEVSKGRVRDVKAFDDPGPVGRPGNTAGAMGKLEDEVWETLGREGWGSVP